MNLIELLIEQCKNPKGALGSLMISIMNIVHYGMVNGLAWAISASGHTKGYTLYLFNGERVVF